MAINTLYPAIKMSPGFTKDVIWMNKEVCSVTSKSSLITEADAFQPLRTHHHY